MKTAATHRQVLADYDRKRALVLEGDCVVFAEGDYLQVSMICKIGRRWCVEGGRVKDGVAQDVTVYLSDLTKAIKDGAEVLRS